MSGKTGQLNKQTKVAVIVCDLLECGLTSGTFPVNNNFEINCRRTAKAAGRVVSTVE